MNDDFECNCAVCQSIDQPVVHEVCGCYECHDYMLHSDADWSSDCDVCWTERFHDNQKH